MVCLQANHLQNNINNHDCMIVKNFDRHDAQLQLGFDRHDAQLQLGFARHWQIVVSH